MSHEIDRRAMLRLSAVTGAGELAAPLLAARASAAGSASAARATSAGLNTPGRGASAAGSAAAKAADRAADRIVRSVRRPGFPDRFFPITSFGAVGDGTTDCTGAFRDAIAACSRRGGHVIVPAGTFFTGAIHLLSNVDLHLEQGSVILFSQDPNAYLPVVFTRWQGVELMNYSPPVYSYGQHNIAITGQGTLNGQAAQNGGVQSQLTNTQTDLTDQQNTLGTMIGNIAAANVAQATANLQQAQLAIQASAQVFLALQNTSLLNVLTASGH